MSGVIIVSWCPQENQQIILDRRQKKKNRIRSREKEYNTKNPIGKESNMKTDAEKRASERHGYAADIMVSYFNKKHSYNAEILNLGLGGICFKSSLFLLPGATVYIRLKKIHSNSSSTGFCEGLRSFTLAEVKWCNELPGAKALPYGVGAKYFAPVY